MPDQTITTDVAIIGAGTAGMTAFRAATRAGKRAVLIESGPYGTTCARVGCMPSKLLIAAADAAHTARTAATFGVHAGPVRVDGHEVMHRVRSERDRFVGFVLDDIHAIDSESKLTGHARFVSDTRLQLDDGTFINTKATVIATGSTPASVPELADLGERLIVNDDVFSWTDLPRRVLVVGAGVIGMELGQALARLGVQTCIINRSGSVGGLRDPNVRESARQAFQNELDVRLNTRIEKAWRDDDGVHVTLASTGDAQSAGHDAGSTMVVDYVLVAIGRRPNVDDLGLDTTSVPRDDRDRVLVDPATQQLGSAPIFMAGDVTGTLPILHEAADEGYIAGHNAAHYPEVIAGKRRAPLAIVFTDPQLAQVGLHYPELPDTDVAYGEVSFANQGRSRVIGKNYGMLRIYANKITGRFLGAEMAGPEMEHIAHLLAWAWQQQLTIAQMLEMPFYHPVIEEGLRTALRNTLREVTG